jgi:hypothetical protein
MFREDPSHILGFDTHQFQGFLHGGQRTVHPDMRFDCFYALLKLKDRIGTIERIALPA